MRSRPSFDKIISFQGFKLNYRKIGTGQPVILLHGSVTSNPWLGFEEKLAQIYSVYLPELPGFGASEAITGRRHNISLFSEALATFISSNQLEMVPIIAFSLGTVVALQTAANRQTGGRLILVGMPGKLSGWKYRITQILPLGIKRKLANVHWVQKHIILPILSENLDPVNKSPDSKEALHALSSTDPRAIVDIDVKREIEESLPTLFGKIENPMDFIYGQNDKLQNTTTQFITLPTIIPNVSHNVFATNPDFTLNVIQKMLANSYRFILAQSVKTLYN